MPRFTPQLSYRQSQRLFI